MALPDFGKDGQALDLSADYLVELIFPAGPRSDDKD